MCLWSANADACGCFAPPVPSSADESFAVNQQAEQIIFEVRDNTVSAHVRIFYQGDPAEFAWLLPMPSVPELELSSSLLFGLIDQQSAPRFFADERNLCPDQKYYCESHGSCDGAADAGLEFDSVDDSESEPAGYAPAVEVLARERIGSYETVTFAADEATAAVDWLNENGFIINETMSPYMQPYLDMNMVFIASRLVPGADLDEIRPLRLTYEASAPSIPLQLTAIAADPHLTVTSFIYADEEYDPAFLPLTEIPEEDLLASGRNNYPMVLARAVDEAGGNAFVKEYAGRGPVFTDPTGCCESPDEDWCYIGGDTICQCPESNFDAQDCSSEEELVEAISMARELADTYRTMTRLTTRVSADEMTFNPEFIPAKNPSGGMRLNLRQTEYSLRRCEDQVIDTEAYEEVTELTKCGAVYCDFGECVITEQGAGCVCEEGFVARAFVDSDGRPSITCVPEVNTVDFSAGGLELPDACDGVSVTDGDCTDVGGFAAVACDEDRGAALGPEIGGVASVICSPIERHSGGPGASNPTPALLDLEVCAPAPPSCSADGWLVETSVSIEGVLCGDEPHESWFEEPPEPDCSGSDGDSATTDVYVTEDADGETVRLAPDDDVETTAPRPERVTGGDDGCSVAQERRRSREFPSLLWLSGLALVIRRRRPMPRP